MAKSTRVKKSQPVRVRKPAAKAAKPKKPPAIRKKQSVAPSSSGLYVGIGGWTFAPWRGVFYPDKFPQAKELSYAAAQLTSIEINGTYYGSQKPETFRKWAGEVPDGFVFSVKGPRFATNRKILAEAGESITRFYDSGVLELRDRLGPVLWQFAPTKKFDAADFGAFLALLPRERDGQMLRHAIEVRHDSFLDSAFIALARQFHIAVVYADHATYPAMADLTADFVYARLQTGRDDIATAYPVKALAEWTARLRTWADGGEPTDLPRITPPQKPASTAPRDVFAYVIHEGKVRAPAAAIEILAGLAPHATG